MPGIDDAEAIARELRRRADTGDPVAFASRFEVDRKRFTPDAWQCRFLESRANRRIFNVARQCGKSTVAAVAAAYGASYGTSRLTLCVSPSERQSKELLRKVRGLLRQLGTAFVAESTTELELPNGCRVVSLPASERTIRNYAANLIIEDEAGDVPDEVHVAILPMIAATHGDLVLMGTPKGRRGHFFDAWERGGQDWERYEVKAAECVRMDAKELERQKRALGAWYAQEYEASFVTVAAGLVYSAFDERVNLIADPPLPLNSTTWRFLLGADFGVKDACAFVVLGFLPNDPNAYILQSYKETGMLPPQALRYIKSLPFKFTRMVGDDQGLGKVYTEWFRQEGLPMEGADKPGKAGHIDLLNGYLAEGRVQIVRPKNRSLVEELTSLPWAEGKRKEAPGYENHLTDAMLYVFRSAVSYLGKPKRDARPTEVKQAADEAKMRYEKNKAHHDPARRESYIDPVYDDM